tara:strand:+ start:956 stop:1153 length:198 start_codon:yes stop_codon:yes gene_type:complete
MTRNTHQTDITWTVDEVGNQVKDNVFECILFGEDEEGYTYSGIAIVIDPNGACIIDKVEDIEDND